MGNNKNIKMKRRHISSSLTSKIFVTIFITNTFYLSTSEAFYLRLLVVPNQYHHSNNNHLLLSKINDNNSDIHETTPIEIKKSTITNEDARKSNQMNHLKTTTKSFCQLAPLWITVAAIVGIYKSSTLTPTLGSLTVMQNSLATLMLAMGLTITPGDLSSAILQKPWLLLSNAMLCFGIMPLLAISLSQLCNYTPHQTAGIVLLGSVSGGQASNLFTLLAGGDVALSIVCTLTTTLLGVIATPLLIKLLLQCIVVVDGIKVLKSVASLVLIPLLCGLGLGKLFDKSSIDVNDNNDKNNLFLTVKESVCPLAGVLSTLILVAGGAANSGFSMARGQGGGVNFLASCLLPIVGGSIALFCTQMVDKIPFAQLKNKKIKESARRALVIETFSKSPTLAYVLAQKHFGPSAACIPACGMVSLAVIGAIVASIWSLSDPPKN